MPLAATPTPTSLEWLSRLWRMYESYEVEHDTSTAQRQMPATRTKEIFEPRPAARATASTHTIATPMINVTTVVA